MGHGIAGLLLAAAAGYWVLERASSQKGQMRQVGLLVGSLIVVGSLLAAVCSALCMSGGCPMGGKWGKKGLMKGGMCPFTHAPATPAP